MPVVPEPQNGERDSTKAVAATRECLREWSSSAISYMGFLCKGISNSDYARLNESFDIFIMSSGLSP